MIIMKIIDVPNLDRISQNPDKRIVVFSDGQINQNGVIIKRIELLEYLKNPSENEKPYSTITALIETDQGDIEILYDEGNLGDNALDESVNILTQNLGLSGLILRSLISLKNKLGKIEK